MTQAAAGASKVPLFPEKDPLDEIFPSNIRLTKRMWARLDRIAELEDKSRAEVIAFFLEWACNDYEHARHVKHPKK